MVFKTVREVWRKNFESEILKIYDTLQTFPYVAIDTEFPGFLVNTPRQSTFEQRYTDLKNNVDRLKPIQLGLTLFKASGEVGDAWQVNFCNFNPNVDVQIPASIKLLEESGINMMKNYKEGVDSYTFVDRLMKIVNIRGDVRFVTFHGLYDMGYFLKLATRSPLPNSAAAFQTMIAHVFGVRIYDIKFMARFFSGLLGGELGLSRLANILGVERTGECHQAGSDSLLIACVFKKMKQIYKFDERFYEGLMYAMKGKIQGRQQLLIPVLQPRQQFYYQVQVPVHCQYMHYLSYPR